MADLDRPTDTEVPELNAPTLFVSRVDQRNGAEYIEPQYDGIVAYLGAMQDIVGLLQARVSEVEREVQHLRARHADAAQESLAQQSYEQLQGMLETNVIINKDRLRRMEEELQACRENEDKQDQHFVDTLFSPEAQAHEKSDDERPHEGAVIVTVVDAVEDSGDEGYNSDAEQTDDATASTGSAVKAIMESSESQSSSPLYANFVPGLFRAGQTGENDEAMDDY